MSDITSSSIELPRTTEVDEAIHTFRILINLSAPVTTKNYVVETKRKKIIVDHFKAVEKEYKKVKKQYEEYLARFHSNIDAAINIYSPTTELVSVPTEPKNIMLCQKENSFIIKINHHLLHGNIGNVLPSYDNFRIKQCSYRSLELCRRRSCQFYHEGEQRNFKSTSWGQLINNKKTLIDELELFKKKALKDKRDIIDEHMAFSMHNLLILLSLMENCKF